MENQEKNTVKPDESTQKENQAQPDHTGLDNWNDRLDENLENEETSDPIADEKAEKYSAENGSGDQSDENGPVIS